MSKQRNKIIEAIYHDARINQCISRMEPAHLRDDLKAEIMLYLCKMDESKLVRLHSAGQLVAYTIQAIVTTCTSSTNTFYRTYRKTMAGEEHIPHDIPEDTELEDRALIEMEQDGMYKIIKFIRRIAKQKHPKYHAGLERAGIKWYNQHILSLYLEHRNYRAIERETRIPFESCYYTVKETITLLQEYAKSIKP